MKRLKTMLFSKPIKMAGMVVLVIVIFFFDNIRGYYRFKELCEAEGGLRVYHKLQKDVGWTVTPTDPIFAEESARAIASFDHVQFARYTDKKDGITYDLRYFGQRDNWRDKQNKSLYDRKLADLSKPVIYEWRDINEHILGESRTSRSGNEVWGITSKQLMLRWYEIRHSTFNQDKTLLGAPSNEQCPKLPKKWSHDMGIFDPKNIEQYFAQ